MKRILNILLISSLLLISCKKEFLEILPESSLTIDLVFKTDKDFQDAIIGGYKELSDFYKYYWQLGDLPGDDTWQAAPRVQDRIRIDNFAVDVNDGILSNTWRDLYQVIERTNTLLARGEESDASVITNRDIYVGEAKLMRSLAYFHLVRVFGDVPMITKPVSMQDALKTTRTSKDIIYNDVIIPGLMEAESKLPLKWDSKNVGRATQGAAKSLLGLVYLTTKKYDSAEMKLREVTQMGYELLPRFEDLFNFSNEHHKEYIFDIEYIDGNLGLDSPFTRDMLVETQDVGTPFRNALRALWGIQGPESGGGGTPALQYVAIFEPADQRKYRTATLGIFDATGNWIPIPPGAAVPAICQKYTTSIVTDGKTNWRVVRYADVLLMLAEAMNENGKTTEALTYLNMIRTRAGVPTYTGLTKDDARDKILHERRLELYMEGHRWFDLVRTGRALSTCSSLGMKEHMTIFPIPQTQIEVINDPSILPQNPGY